MTDDGEATCPWGPEDDVEAAEIEQFVDQQVDHILSGDEAGESKT